MNRVNFVTLLLCLLACHANIPLSAQSTIAETLAGQWKFVASPFEGGGIEIAFTATPSADGTALQCHADPLLTRSQTYAANWQLAIEQNEGQVRLGWLLNADVPAFEQEFQENASQYALFGSNPDGTPRYVYLLSENIDTQKLEPLTLWSDWQPADGTIFTLPVTQQIYAVVSKNKPYSGSVGYAEIWASGRLVRVGGTGISMLDAQRTQSMQRTQSFDLQGRRMGRDQMPTAKGIYIVNGKKYVR